MLSHPRLSVQKSRFIQDMDLASSFPALAQAFSVWHLQQVRLCAHQLVHHGGQLQDPGPRVPVRDLSEFNLHECRSSKVPAEQIKET